MNTEATDLAEACDYAVAWARLAGARALQKRRSGKVHQSRKGDDSLVTSVDLELDALLLNEIRRHYPSHAICSEESCERDSGPATRLSEYCWVVDPLDGTRNFAHGFPCFSIAIALCSAGRPVVGVVHEVLTGRSYRAISGLGAYLNDIPLAVATTGWHRDTLIGIPSAKGRPLPPVVEDVWSERAVFRNVGSTCLHLALVAAGGLDACFGLETKLWDVTAGALLVTEAGGVVTSMAGENIFPVDTKSYRNQNIAFLAGSAVMHERLLDTLKNP